jgi:uncharacterized membrane protein
MVASQARGFSSQESTTLFVGLGTRSATPLLGLAAIGQSLALFVTTLGLPAAARVALFAQNTRPASAASLTTSSILGFLPAAVAAALIVRQRERGLARVARSVRIFAPLALAFALPALFTWQIGQQRPIAYLILLSVFVLAAERLLRISFGELSTFGLPEWVPARSAFSRWALPRTARLVPFALVCVMSAAYAAYMSFYTIRHHRLLHSSAFDLGIFDNLLYNTIKGHFFQAPVMFGPGHHNSVSTHAEYLMVLFAPIYAIWPRPETLLVIQSVLLGAAAIPLYFFTRTLLSAVPAVLIAAAYLLFAPLHGPQFYDFHWLTLCEFFFFWLFYAIATRKTWLSVLMVLLLFALREDLAVGLAFLGVFLFITGLREKFGLRLALVSAVWFVINKFVIMPWAGPWWFDNIYVELFADGKSGYGNVIKTLISNPFFALSTAIRGPKLTYALHMLAPLAFLPLRRLSFWLLLIPGSVFTLMTTGYWPTLSIAFQYTTHWIPFIFATAVIALFLMRQEKQGQVRMAAALGALCIAVLSHSYNFGAILQRESFTGGFGRVSFEMSNEARERYEELLSVTRKIPQNASAASTENLTPHISSRVDAYVFRYDVGPVDYILVSEGDMGGDLRNTLSAKFSKEHYGLFAQGKHDFYLFKRGHDSPETAAALRRLRISVHPVPSH